MSNNELIKYVNGESRPAFSDRQVSKEAKKVFDQVRLAGLKADGAMALGVHIMQSVAEMDQHRRSIAGNDEELNQVLMAIEGAAIRQAQMIQMSVNNNTWRL